MADDCTTSHRLSARKLSVGYDPVSPVLATMDIHLPPGRITTLIGANGSGKSTLLRSLGRALAPLAGTVLLDGADIAGQRRRQVAQTLSLLPQSPVAPDGLTVQELCEFGRHPHRGFLGRASALDRAAVTQAIAAARLTDLAERRLDTLSGGQRQRAWIAMALAQQTPIMLLDEPTTYLDIAHQIEVLDLLRELNCERGTTVVMVLHDLAQAAQYADHLVAVAAGAVHAEGTPQQVIVPAVIEAVFGVSALVVPHPVTGRPLCLPLSSAGSADRGGEPHPPRRP